MSEQIAVLFGPVGGNAEKVANLIKNKLGSNNCILLNVSKADETLIKKYDKIIFGVSTIGTHTWTDEKSASDWDVFLPKFRNIDFAGKSVAIYGLGDQIAYANHFVDDMKIVYDIVIQQGGKVVGHWPTDGYDFNDSEAIIDKMFVGLAIDEDRQKDLTEERVSSWIDKIVSVW